MAAKKKEEAEEQEKKSKEKGKCVKEKRLEKVKNFTGNSMLKTCR